MTGGTVGQYVVLEQLGAGGMGIVYRARDPRLRREVALKVLRHSDPNSAGARSRLLREARAISALNHPNICTVYDIDEQNDQIGAGLGSSSGQAGPWGARRPHWSDPANR